MDANPEISNIKSEINNLNLPDPERSYKNIETFISENPEYARKLVSTPHFLLHVCQLFSYSQFLANYSIKNPDALFNALNNLDIAFDTETLKSELGKLFSSCSSVEEGMKAVRNFKKNNLLIIILKDILRKAEFQDIVFDMSNLADAVLCESLNFVELFLRQRYGILRDNSVAIIALGKLGARELNFSSDVDIIFVYKEEGETTGICTIQGVNMNRISAHEYYSKLAEDLTRFLSANTEDGFAYRVDLRLRPQGQKGSLALPLRDYEDYYESWGQLWERAALLRARPVAGDTVLGHKFLQAITPFVFRKYLDFEAIDEIRRMKSQVEQLKAGTLGRDIKRGYGGIREIEFFIQIFQLMYGGKEPLLRERGTFKALHRLLLKGLIGYEDLGQLSDNYIFLRTLEHRLQQMNDIQTHNLPSGNTDLDILSRKMAFADKTAFLQELNMRRHKVRTIYDSLLETTKAPLHGQPYGLLSSVFWDIETPLKHLLKEELSKTGVKDIEKAIQCLMKIRNNIYSFQTIKGRRLLEEILPKFVDEALRETNADLALLHLVDFSGILSAKESYLEAIAQKPEIISVLNFVFSQSEYLSKMLMGSPENIESIVEGGVAGKSLTTLMGELKLLIKRHGESTAIRLFKKFEEIKMGILFMDRKTGATGVMKALSKTAEAVLQSLVNIYRSPASPDRQHPMPDNALSIIGFGKLGGREIIFNSDLDLVFVTLNEPAEIDIKNAEQILKICMSYTKDGMAYKVDTRLRPDGSKGPLVNSIKGIKDYYFKNAQVWELQALLKARPVCNFKFQISNFKFMEIRRDVLMARGNEISVDDIRKMRGRIQKELSKETSGAYDIKLGSGGLEDLEFIIQYLQLKNCKNRPYLIVQGTLDAIKRLDKSGIIVCSDAEIMKRIYLHYRTIEIMLRLRNESVLKKGDSTLQSLSGIMDMNERSILDSLHRDREWVRDFMDAL